MNPVIMQALLRILVLVISQPALQDAGAAIFAPLLAQVLPDVTEDAIADFLHKVADKLEAAN